MKLKNKILFVASLNLFFAFFELIGGIFTNSLSILSDALHDLGDALALFATYFLEKKSEQKKDLEFSYGYRRWSLLSVFLLGVLLISGSILIFWEALQRLSEPQMTKPLEMIGFAVVGLLVNAFSLFKLKGGHHHHDHGHGYSLQENVLHLHFIEDLLGWAIVLVGAILIYFFQLNWLDPILAMVLSVWVFYNAFKNLSKSFRIFLQASPDNIQVQELKNEITKIAGVLQVHHIHLWSLDGKTHILTAHLVVPSTTKIEDTNILKNKVKRTLLEKFHIHEATLEIELESEICADPEHNH